MGPGGLHDPSGMGGYNVALSPAQDQQQHMGSGLPPMSTFRNSATGPMGLPQQATQPGAVQSPYNHSPSLGPVPVGAGPVGQTSGDALGKALASIYSADQSTSSFSSHPTTPVSSPPPLTSVSQQQQQQQQQWNSGPTHPGAVGVANTASPLYNERNLHMVRTIFRNERRKVGKEDFGKGLVMALCLFSLAVSPATFFFFFSFSFRRGGENDRSSVQ